MKTYTKKILIGAILIGIFIGISLTFWVTLRQAGAASASRFTPTAEVVVETHASYAKLSRVEMLKQSDAIVTGLVTNILPTRFNQDSGKVWEPKMNEVEAIPLALHYVEVQIDAVLLDVVGLEKIVTIAVLGTSPIESASQADHQLKHGDQVIVFLQFDELVWREGSRPVWRFVGAPAESALVLQSDGLYHDGWRDESPLTVEELKEQIAQQRSP